MAPPIPRIRAAALTRTAVAACLLGAALVAGADSGPLAAAPGAPVQLGPAGAPRATPGLDQEILYKLLVAEFAGQRGQLELSVQSYLEVAKRTRDPSIVERAVRIAVYARQDAAALEAAGLWAEVAPENHEARRVLAALLLRAGRIDDAVRQLDHLVRTWQGPPDQAYALVVDMLVRERDRAQALQAMERLIHGRETELAALLAYAHVALRTGDLQRARDVLAQYLRGSPGDQQAQVLFAQVLQAQSRTEEALSYLGEVRQREPDNFTARLAYARLLVTARRFDDALNEFRELSEKQPDNGDVRYALGLLLLQTTRVDEARAQFEELVRLDKHTLTARYYLGQIAESSGDTAAAMEHYRVVDEGEHYLDAQIRVAVLLAKQGKLELARSQLHGVETASDKDTVRLYLVEAELLVDAEQRQAAIDLYGQALEAYPDDSDLLYARAMLSEKMGNLQQLERDLRRILAREPDNAQALNALGYTLADRTDRYQEAYELISRALALKPNDYYILDSMGWVLYRLGRAKEAVEYLRRAAQLSDDAEVAAHLGEVLWALGEQDAARQVWNSALQATPDDQLLNEVIKRFSP